MEGTENSGIPSYIKAAIFNLLNYRMGVTYDEFVGWDEDRKHVIKLAKLVRDQLAVKHKDKHEEAAFRACARIWREVDTGIGMGVLQALMQAAYPEKTKKEVSLELMQLSGECLAIEFDTSDVTSFCFYSLLHPAGPGGGGVPKKGGTLLRKKKKRRSRPKTQAAPTPGASSEGEVHILRNVEDSPRRNQQMRSQVEWPGSPYEGSIQFEVEGHSQEEKAGSSDTREGDALMAAALAPVVQEIRVESSEGSETVATFNTPRIMNITLLEGAIPQGLGEQPNVHGDIQNAQHKVAGASAVASGGTCLALDTVGTGQGQLLGPDPVAGITYNRAFGSYDIIFGNGETNNIVPRVSLTVHYR